MSLQATWLGRESLDRIADVRLRCYGPGPADRPEFLARTAGDRFADGDVLVLSDATGDLATATHLPLTMNVRGGRLPCQGVAWVGTVKSHRRRKVDGRGLASRVMDALRRRARDDRQAVSLLSPFRVSFYEAFGYGVVERQHTWTIPTALLPTADDAAEAGANEGAGGFGEYRDADFAAALACRDRQFRDTHGDVATDAGGLRHWLAALAPQGFRFVDRRGDAITSQFTLGTEIHGKDGHDDARGVAVVHRPYWDSPAALRRLLAMLGTLRDQYSLARVTLPVDLPINWWLRERQVPHRRVDHPAARCRAITRMQAAVLDVPAFAAALTPRPGVAGAFTVDVDGQGYHFHVDGHGDGGRVAATPVAGTTARADLGFDAPTWAAVAFGDLPVRTAVAFGRVDVASRPALDLLAAVVGGPPPYCHEYF